MEEVVIEDFVVRLRDGEVGEGDVDGGDVIEGERGGSRLWGRGAFGGDGLSDVVL